MTAIRVEISSPLLSWVDDVAKACFDTVVAVSDAVLDDGLDEIVGSSLL